MSKSFETVIRLRRDNDYNYEKVKNSFIPANGEVVLVDTAGAGLRAKVGDGVNTYATLSYIDEELRDQVIMGYFNGEKFYYNNDFTDETPTYQDSVYINKLDNKLYTYTGMEFIPAEASVATASAETAGVLKLYQTIGQNIDGTMSQKAITDELNARYKTKVDSINEQLTFYLREENE